MKPVPATEAHPMAPSLPDAVHTGTHARAPQGWRRSLPYWIAGVGSLGLGLAAIVSIRVTGSGVAVWLANALIVGLASRHRGGRRRLGIFCAGAAGILAANALAGHAWPTSAMFTALNLLECVLAWAGLYLLDVRHELDPDERDFFVGVPVAVLAAPAVSACLGAWWLSATAGRPFWTTAQDWWIGDVLGMLALIPLVWTASAARFRALLGGARAAEFWTWMGLTLFACVAASLWLARPFVVITLPLLVAGYRLGLFRLSLIGLCAVIAVMAVAALAHRDALGGLGQELNRLSIGQLGFYCGLCLLGPLLVSIVVQQREALAVELRHLGWHDPLTGLPNRALLDDRLARGSGHGIEALLFIDLDRFKTINDTCGHDAGDKVLQETARRFAANLRESDQVYRHGGDEFVLVLHSLAEAQDAGRIAGKLIRALEAPIAADGDTLSISASIGIALFPQDAHDMRALIKLADAALYHAKGAGGGVFRYYDASMAEAGAAALAGGHARRAAERPVLH